MENSPPVVYSDRASPADGQGRGASSFGVKPLSVMAAVIASCSEGRGPTDGTKLFCS